MSETVSAALERTSRVAQSTTAALAAVHGRAWDTLDLALARSTAWQAEYGMAQTLARGLNWLLPPAGHGMGPPPPHQPFSAFSDRAGGVFRHALEAEVALVTSAFDVTRLWMFGPEPVQDLAEAVREVALESCEAVAPRGVEAVASPPEEVVATTDGPAVPDLQKAPRKRGQNGKKLRQN